MQPNNQPQPPVYPGPAVPPPQVYAQPTADPGKGLGIAGIVLAFFAPLIGLILSIVSKSRSKRAGQPGGLGLTGIILNSIMMVIGTVVAIMISVVVFNSLERNAQQQLNTTGSSSLEQSAGTDGPTVLNSLGTVADAQLQDTLVKKLHDVHTATTGAVGNLEILSIRSQQTGAGSYTEEWTVSIGDQQATYTIDLQQAADGGTNYSIHLQ